MEIVNNETGEMVNVEEMTVSKGRFDSLDTKEWLSLNAKLQTKKSKARELLVKMGVLEKKGHNKYDDYKYFTEAQYKEIANQLLVGAKIEIKSDLINMFSYTGDGKMPIGRKAVMSYQLHDTETGFYEETIIEGEGLDRGDKAGYKAYTGAVKYYLANTFLVPTGDDPENDSPNGKEGDEKKPTTKKPENKIATKTQVDKIRTLYQTEDEINKILSVAKIDKLEQLTDKLATYFINFKIKASQPNENE